jgi:hypothetical protein
MYNLFILFFKFFSKKIKNKQKETKRNKKKQKETKRNKKKQKSKNKELKWKIF